MFARRGRDHPSLRCPLVGVREHEPLENPGVQPLSDQTQQHSVTYPSAKDLPEVEVFDGVEKLSDVDLDDPPPSHPPRRVPDCAQRLVLRATRPEAVREVVKLLLVDLADHHRHRALQDLVLEGRDADRTGLRPIALRDVHPPHRRRPVLPGLRAVEERLEVGLQVLRVRCRALSVDT